MIWHDLTREPIRQQPKVDQEEDLLLERPITKLGWKFHFSLENRFEATSERTFDLSSFEGISSWLSSEGKDSFPDCRFSPWVNFLMVWPLVANFLAPFSRGGHFWGCEVSRNQSEAVKMREAFFVVFFVRITLLITLIYSFFSMCHSVLGSETPSWDKCCGTWSSKGALALVLGAVAFEVVLRLN